MEGQRVEKKLGGGSKKIWIIVGAAAGVLLAAYLGLCAWVGSMDTIFPNVSVLGVDVSGMTQEQAKTALEDVYKRQLFLQVKQVLEENKAERHIRGGIATRRKYKGV